MIMSSTELTTTDTATSIVRNDDGPKKDSIVVAMEEHGITDDYIAGTMKDIMDNAVTANPKTGDLLVDYGVRLQAVRAWHKITSGKPDISIQIANVFPTGSNIL